MVKNIMLLKQIVEPFNGCEGEEDAIGSHTFLWQSCKHEPSWEEGAYQHACYSIQVTGTPFKLMICFNASTLFGHPGLGKQFDQDLHCLPFRVQRLTTVLCGKTTLFEF